MIDVSHPIVRARCALAITEMRRRPNTWSRFRHDFYSAMLAESMLSAYLPRWQSARKQVRP